MGSKHNFCSLSVNSLAILKMKHRNMVYIIYFLFFFRDVFLGATKVSELLPASAVSIIYRILLLAIILVGIITIFLYETFLAYELLKIIIILGITTISVIMTGQYMLLEGAILIICCKKIDLDDLMRFALKIQVYLSLIVIFLALIGVIEIGYVQRSAGIMRCSLGFSHPNRLAMIVFQINCEIFYLNRKRVTWMLIAACFGLNVISYVVTNSNTGLIVNVVFDMAMIFYKVNHLEEKARSKQIRRLVYLLLLSVIIGTAIFIYAFNKSPDYFINKLSGLSTVYSRFILIPKYYNAYRISLFGSKILEGSNIVLPGYGNTYGYLDCGYAALFIRDGVFFALIFITGMATLVKMKIKEGNWAAIIIIILYLLYLMLEKVVLILPMNFFLIMLADVLFRKNPHVLRSETYG